MLESLPGVMYLYDEQRAGTALVFVDRPAGHLDADSVASNNLGGSVQAVEHLLAHGHRRIAFLGDLPSISTAEDSVMAELLETRSFMQSAADLVAFETGLTGRQKTRFGKRLEAEIYVAS